MIKKIGSAGLLVGGLLAAIGAIIAFVNIMNEKTNAVTGMAVMSRVGAIIVFVAAIAVVADVFMTANPKKVGAIVGMVFGVIAFVGQFLINPITGERAAWSAILSSNAQAAAGGAAIGLILLAVSGIVGLIMGIVGLASKDKTHFG